MDPANTDGNPLKPLMHTLAGGAKAAAYLVAEMHKRNLPLTLADLTREDFGLVYGGALLKSCTRVVELEEENEALREEIRRGSGAPPLQEEVAMDAGKEDERHGPEGLARQDVHPPRWSYFLHRIQESGRGTDSEANVHYI